MNKTSNASEKPPGVIKISGQIKNYKETRARANFFFTENDQNVMGMAAIGAALAGNSGQAMGTAISASDMEEEADYLEFEIDNIKVKGWVWCSPFKNDDYVEVVGEWNEACFELAAIARPEDRMIALYPHCSRGKTAHARNALKWWFIGVTGGIGAVIGIFSVASGVFGFESVFYYITPVFLMLLLFVSYLFYGKKGLVVYGGVLISLLISLFGAKDIFQSVVEYWPVVLFLYVFLIMSLAQEPLI